MPRASNSAIAMPPAGSLAGARPRAQLCVIGASPALAADLHRALQRFGVQVTGLTDAAALRHGLAVSRPEAVLLELDATPATLAMGEACLSLLAEQRFTAAVLLAGPEAPARALEGLGRTLGLAPPLRLPLPLPPLMVLPHLLPVRRDLHSLTEQDLADALFHRRLHAWLQPVVDAMSGAVLEVEALARWSHPRHGVVPAEAFLSLALSAGLLPLLSEAMLQEAADAVEALGASGHDLPVSVNLSLSGLMAEGFVDRLQALMLERRVPADRLRLELSGSAAGMEEADLQRIMGRLRDLGVALALDDFGSSLLPVTWIQRLPLSELKLDRRLVVGLAQAPERLPLVRALIGLGLALERPVIACGVEDEAAAQLLRICGCTRLQGHFVGRPQPLALLIGWLDEFQPAGAVRVAL